MTVSLSQDAAEGAEAVEADIWEAEAEEEGVEGVEVEVSCF